MFFLFFLMLKQFSKAQNLAIILFCEQIRNVSFQYVSLPGWRPNSLVFHPLVILYVTCEGLVTLVAFHTASITSHEHNHNYMNTSDFRPLVCCSEILKVPLTVVMYKVHKLSYYIHTKLVKHFLPICRCPNVILKLSQDLCHSASSPPWDHYFSEDPQATICPFNILPSDRGSHHSLTAVWFLSGIFQWGSDPTGLLNRSFDDMRHLLSPWERSLPIWELGQKNGLLQIAASYSQGDWWACPEHTFLSSFW